ncbi:unnamed protein product [Prorocentrum cordatum]|uniref:Phospholipase B-like n=1 Tax=Prorocentrum cordatum TaxID=2364126 RepID=A0ABN9UD39_9DINO|nr:unnamed protein product [Polarella glacialis]
MSPALNARSQHEAHHFAIRAFAPPVTGAAQAGTQQVRGQLFIAMSAASVHGKIGSSVPLAFWSSDVFSRAGAAVGFQGVAAATAEGEALQHQW